MINHPHQDHVEELNEMRNKLQTFQTEWLETLDQIEKNQTEVDRKDLFDMIDYLTFCDELCTILYIEIKELNTDLQTLKKLKEEFKDHPNTLHFIHHLIVDMQELRKNKLEKLQQNIDEGYESLADDVLRRSDDLISAFSEEIQQERVIPTLNNQINQNLEKELFLQELKDSLESYRETREEFLTEVESKTLQTQPEDQIPEDFGEEKPEMDSILSQLDLAITACDSALLREEIGD